MKYQLVRIEAPHFVAGLVYNQETKKASCRRWAPIINYMSSWNLGEMTRYCKKKDWVFEVLGEFD